MSFLLDTNVVSELRKKSRCHPSVAAWQDAIQGEQIFISAISMMEIKAGVIAARRKNPEFSNILNQWYEMQVKPAFHKRVIPVDLAVSECCSVFLSQRTRPLADALIAATAHVHSLTLATRNVADFSDMEIDLINPWEWSE